MLLKCYYDQKYDFFVLPIFRKYKYILLTYYSVEIRTGSPIILTVIFEFGLPPLLNSNLTGPSWPRDEVM